MEAILVELKRRAPGQTFLKHDSSSPVRTDLLLPFHFYYQESHTAHMDEDMKTILRQTGAKHVCCGPLVAMLLLSPQRENMTQHSVRACRKALQGCSLRHLHLCVRARP
ncbi:hypothetical protein DPX16_13145 [Anabarilius grahami]|uniref:Uncharacterized protein n=1 Tax=Anabarilius grahami TaxID=495550 RepID=A0A3N0YNC9_ANAGA|nr:hypothetical protein DPX16_13145 [Anabarilius grahami]